MGFPIWGDLTPSGLHYEKEEMYPDDPWFKDQEDEGEDGELLAEVMVTDGFQLQWVGEEAVWGLVLDELDVPYLVKRPLHRR